jgi:phage FluMu protein Com
MSRPPGDPARFEPNGSVIGIALQQTNDNVAGTSGWYLTVRCTVCARLIAFQKARFPGRSPNLRIETAGELSVSCPNCKSVVRFCPDQIERQNVVLTP